MEKIVSFGEGIIHLNANENNVMSREGWNGKGMYVKVCKNTEITINGIKLPLNDHFVIKNVNGSFSTWVPSVNDCLSSDWVLDSI